MRSRFAFECSDDEFDKLCEKYAGKSVAYRLINPRTGSRGSGVGSLQFRPEPGDKGWYTLEIYATDEEVERQTWMREVPYYTLPRKALELLRPGTDEGTDWVLDVSPELQSGAEPTAES